MHSRCIMVLGVPRSGSSCVAGVLHKLGVNMGAGNFQPPDWANPRGYYEDMRWRLRTQRITGRGYSLQAAQIEDIGQRQRSLYRALARECARQRLWGMKDPWLCFVGRFLWPILEDQGVEVRLVVTHRDPEASIASVQRHLKRTYHGKGDARHIVETWQAGLDRQIRAWGDQAPAIEVDYDRLVESPKEEIERLAAFAFEGLGPALGDQVAIARWVSPELRHHEGVT